MLTERLRGLEEKGFVYRDYEPTIPPSVTYGLTKRMKDIERVFDDLQQMALKWKQEGPPSRIREKDGAHASSSPV
jgi:DNA-binding HxlR family transcriptional regulator